MNEGSVVLVMREKEIMSVLNSYGGKCDKGCISFITSWDGPSRVLLKADRYSRCPYMLSTYLKELKERKNE